MCRGAPRRHLASNVYVIFHRDGDPEQRQSFARVNTMLSVRRLYPGVTSPYDAVGVQLAVKTRNAIEIHLHQLW
jgi:hypothetical protein